MTLYLATTATHRCLVEADTAELARAYAQDALMNTRPLGMNTADKLNRVIVLTVEEVTLPHILNN